MAEPISPAVSLAMSMHSQPGIYAVLLGSGASKSAGIPTGWDVVTNLVTKAGALLSKDDETAQNLARDEPEKWWREHGGGELGYSDLLEAIASTSGARQGLLETYFEPNNTTDDEPRPVSACHQAIAKLVARGTVKVIITTNFDRLMENALAAEGISPQVISRPEAVVGMKPLAHAPATIIKIHGDYKDLDSLNTPDELATYPQQWSNLLAQIFDEYGLIVSGWSADWDTALVHAIEEVPNRRYPLYWDSLSAGGGNAQRLLALRSGMIIPSTGADQTFTELVANLEALDRLTHAPLSTEMAVARLKRYLLDPIRRIDLYDLIMDTTDELCTYIKDQLEVINGDAPDQYENVYAGYLEASTRLLTLFIAGAWHDIEGVHDEMWLEVLQRIVDTAVGPHGRSYEDPVEDARYLPGLFLLTAAGVIAAARGRETLFLRLATEISAFVFSGAPAKSPAGQILHPLRLLPTRTIQAMPRWKNPRLREPTSYLLSQDLQSLFAHYIPGDQTYREAFADSEYRLALIHTTQQKTPASLNIVSGQYSDYYAWDSATHALFAEQRFVVQSERRNDWPWPSFFGSPEALEKAVESIPQILKTYGSQ